MPSGRTSVRASVPCECLCAPERGVCVCVCVRARARVRACRGEFMRDCVCVRACVHALE